MELRTLRQIEAVAARFAVPRVCRSTSSAAVVAIVDPLSGQRLSVLWWELCQRCPGAGCETVGYADRVDRHALWSPRASSMPLTSSRRDRRRQTRRVRARSTSCRPNWFAMSKTVGTVPVCGTDVARGWPRPPRRARSPAGGGLSPIAAGARRPSRCADPSLSPRASARSCLSRFSYDALYSLFVFRSSFFAVPGSSCCAGSASSERHRRPTGAGGRDPLVRSVGESAVLRHLHRKRTSADEPRPVGKLRSQKEPNSSLILRAGNGVTGGLQRDKCLSRRVCVCLERRQLCPASILPLKRKQRRRRFADVVRTCLPPGQPQQLHRMVLGRARLGRAQPVDCSRHSLVLL